MTLAEEFPADLITGDREEDYHNVLNDLSVYDIDASSTEMAQNVIVFFDDSLIVYPDNDKHAPYTSTVFDEAVGNL